MKYRDGEAFHTLKQTSVFWDDPSIILPAISCFPALASSDGHGRPRTLLSKKRSCTTAGSGLRP
eukprot:scaffold676_cov316-Pavlova_lutheri.AAC.17